MDARLRAARRRRERWARASRPAAVDLLIVAHAPPASLDRYFYFPSVPRQDSLFREVARAVLKAEPDRDDKRALLRLLRDAGVYLIDVSLEPLPEGSELAPLIPGLLRRIRRLNPQRIVLVKADVYDEAFEAVRDAGLPVIDERIPFPGSGRQQEFRVGFARAIDSRRRPSKVASQPSPVNPTRGDAAGRRGRRYALGHADD